MTIDTNEVVNWVKKHLKICIPVGIAFLSWFLAIKWQGAINSHELAMCIFYFFACAVTGVVSIITICINFGLFDN